MSEGLVGEQAAFREFGLALSQLLSSGDEKVEYLATILSSVTYERARAYTPNGKLDSPSGKFNSVRFSYGLSKLAGALRTANYRAGAGTWFSIRFAVTNTGAATAEYNYDEEPEWDAPVDPIAYVTDQKKFPRDESKQPEWLKRKLVEGQARVAARD